MKNAKVSPVGKKSPVKGNARYRHTTVANELPRDAIADIDGNREADAGRRAGP